jgi:hypothetical protein
MRRGPLTLALGVLAIAGGGAMLARVAFDRLVYEPPPPATPPVGVEEVAAPARVRMVRVLAVHGRVERSTRSGAWTPAGNGDQLAAEDSVRTSPSSTAELGLGERSRITVAGAAQITVREVTSAVDQFRLTRGRIAVDYAESGQRRLRVEDDSGRSVEATDARFGLLATGAMLAVATETGTVTLQARGGAVAVGAREQAAARGDRPPSPAEPIPSALLIKLASAAASQDGDECASLSGLASLASSVDVDGRPVASGDDGRFVVRVRRRRGQAALVVTVSDALGRTLQRTMPCRAQEPHVKDLWLRWKR